MIIPFSATFFLVSAVVVFASFIQSLTGFGFAIVGIPLLLLFLSPEVSIQICLVLGLILSILAIAMDLGKGSKPVLNFPLLLGSLFGIPVGTLVIRAVSPTSLKILVSIVVIVFSYLQIKGFSIQITRQKLAFALVGIISGILISATGLGGLALALFYTNMKLEKKEIRSSMLIFIILASIFTLVSQLISGTLHSNTLLLGLQQTPALLIGLFAGIKMFPYVSSKSYKKVILAIVIFASISSVVSVLQSFLKFG